LTIPQIKELEKQWINKNRFLDIHMATITSILVNTNRDYKKHPEPFSPDDFVLFRDKKEKPSQSREQTLDEQLNAIRLLNAAMGGKEVIRG
jgi:hypothetical protein